MPAADRSRNVPGAAIDPVPGTAAHHGLVGGGTRSGRLRSNDADSDGRGDASHPVAVARSERIERAPAAPGNPDRRAGGGRRRAPRSGGVAVPHGGDPLGAAEGARSADGAVRRKAKDRVRRRRPGLRLVALRVGLMVRRTHRSDPIRSRFRVRPRSAASATTTTEEGLRKIGRDTKTCRNMQPSGTRAVLKYGTSRKLKKGINVILLRTVF
mmetsp:Transcript_8530/g.20861  ORF Transcript_8530/g.20861 Transcript_8530/m.20861 type:complete len:212 (+) Transcript_8530:2117-2752(+)